MTNKTKWILGIIVVVLVVMSIFLLRTAFTGNVVKEDTIKIGFSGVLTGEVAIYGQSGLAAAKLAVEEQNAKGGVNGKKVELIVEDDKLSASESVNIMNKFVNIDKVDAIIIASGSGPTFSGVAVTQQAGIPTMVTTGSAPKITKVGDYIFRTYPSDSVQGKYGAEIIYNQLGKKKVAMLYVKNDWGEGIKDVFKNRYEELGGKLVHESGILQTEDDFRTEIAKVKESGAEALYIPLYPVNLVALAKQKNEMKLNIPMLGADACDGDQGVLDVGDGLMYTLVKIDAPESFLNKVKSVKGFESLNPNVGAATTYDATKVLLLAMEKAGTDKLKIKQELKKTSHQGVSNKVEFENGDLKEAVFETKLIKNGKASKLY